MGELGDILGDDFEEKYESTVQQRRERSRKIPTDVLKRICYTAIHEGGFKGDEPRFIFDAGEFDHDVLLMQAPQENMHKFRHPLGDDGDISMGMFHAGELMSCAFNGEMANLVDKIEEAEYYLVAGSYKEKTVEKDGEKNTYKNIAPVRGIVPLKRAKQMADDYANTASGSSMDEQAKQQASEGSSSDSSDEPDLGGLDDSDDEPDIDSEILEVFQTIANKKPSVLEKVKQGNEEMLSNLTSVVNKNISSTVDSEKVADVFEAEIEPIEGRGEDEEEEDDEPDLAGLGDDDDDEEETTASEESTDDSDDDESDVEDWF